MNITKENALNIAIKYCDTNALSVPKLQDCKHRGGGNGLFAFVVSSGVKPEGLTNDIATMPIPVLLVKHNNEGNLIVEETESTRKYLGK